MALVQKRAEDVGNVTDVWLVDVENRESDRYAPNDLLNVVVPD